jgi:hypothetical protein
MIKNFWKGGWVVFLLLIFSGCTHLKGYYPVSEYPVVSAADLKRNSNPVPIEVSFEFQSNGKFAPDVTEKYRPYVMHVFHESGLFSSVNPSGTPSQVQVEIVMNNAVDSMAGAYAAGLFEGLTLGAIGTKVTDPYIFTAKFRNPSGETITKEYKYGITSASGLIRGGVSGVEPKSSVEDAFRATLEQFILSWLKDLQQQGNLI